MENSSPLILEISSDEEAGFGCARNGVGSGEFGDREDCDWLSKLLYEVGENRDDDSDDVIFVSEVLPKPFKKSRSEFLKPLAEVVADESEGDDDDCVVLDGDPDKPVVVVNGKTDNDDNDSDDLEIVSEKGEVACRDFPHPRHLCAKFPFASTPHEVHCGQCHCHICDSLAPCSHWGTGISSIDHCHASDKDEYWRAERKRMKKADSKSVSTNPRIIDTYLLDSLIQTSQVSALAPPQPDYLPQNQGLYPVTLHPCSISSTVGVPNAVNLGRIHPSGRVVPSYKPRPLLGSLQLHPTRNNNVASRDKSNNLGSRSGQSFPSRAVFKRPGIIGASPNNRHAYRSHLSSDPSLNKYRSFQTNVLNEHRDSNQRKICGQVAHSVLPQPQASSPQSMSVGCTNYLPSQSHTQSGTFSSSLIRDPTHCQSQMPSQPHVGSSFVNAVPLQPCLASQPSGENFESLILPQPHVFQPRIPVPSQTVASLQPDAIDAFGNQLHSSFMISSHLNVGNNFENRSSQPQAHKNIASLLIDGQNDFQQGSHSQNDIDTSPADFGFDLDSSLSHGNLQIHAEVSQHQSKDEFPGSTEPDSLDFQFDSWMFENHSLPGVLEVPMSPVWNVFSPEPASIDTGTLFDI